MYREVNRNLFMNIMWGVFSTRFFIVQNRNYINTVYSELFWLLILVTTVSKKKSPRIITCIKRKNKIPIRIYM